MKMNSHYDGRCTACGCNFKAGTEIDFVRGVGAKHYTVNACALAKQERLEREQRDGGTQLDLKPIVKFLQDTLSRGLKRPKLRVLDVDGHTEIRLSLTKAGVASGSLAIVVGGEYRGGVRPNGQMAGAIAASTILQRHLLLVALDPIKAVKDYAALMSVCSFCGKPLTDAFSVEHGYGPICAKHWGLPHKGLGTSILLPVTQPFVRPQLVERT